MNDPGRYERGHIIGQARQEMENWTNQDWENKLAIELDKNGAQ